jgi:hypothetical protein
VSNTSSPKTSDENLGKVIDKMPAPLKKASDPVTTMLATADKAAIASPPPKPPTPPKTTPVVRDYSDDKPNRAIEDYRSPRDGKVFPGRHGARISQRDTGVNRYAVLIARPGGCTEAEGRHVNPRGYEYSASFAGYVASQTGMTVVTKDGRYQVGCAAGPLPDEASRKAFYDALGGDKYLQQTVNYIRGNAKYDYSGFKLSQPAPALVAA